MIYIVCSTNLGSALHEHGALSIAVLFNANNPVHKIFLGDIENAAQLLSLKLVTFPIGQPDSIDTVIERMRSAGADAVMVLPDDPYLFNLRHRIADKLNIAKLPSMFGLREAVEDGGLMSYGEIYDAGFNSSGRFYEKCTDILGMTPTQYRSHYRSLDWRFATDRSYPSRRSLRSVTCDTSEKGIRMSKERDNKAIVCGRLGSLSPERRLARGIHRGIARLSRAP